MTKAANVKLALLVLVAALVVALPPAARAQSSGPAAGDWEFALGPSFGMSKTVDFNGGSTADIQSSWGGKFGAYYYLSDHLSLGGSYAYASGDFNATVQPGAGTPGGAQLENGHLYSNSFMFNARYSLLDGPIKPYGLIGIGYNFTNTNIASGPPQVGCWWDPWWGYVCNGYQNTKSTSGFEYQVGAGVQLNFSRGFAVQAGYNETWISFHNSSGTPSFGSVDVLFVWRYGSGY
jgi:opacity protein-like surface antigen